MTTKPRKRKPVTLKNNFVAPPALEAFKMELIRTLAAVAVRWLRVMYVTVGKDIYTTAIHMTPEKKFKAHTAPFGFPHPREPFQAETLDQGLREFCKRTVLTCNPDYADKYGSEGNLIIFVPQETVRLVNRYVQRTITVDDLNQF